MALTAAVLSLSVAPTATHALPAPSLQPSGASGTILGTSVLSVRRVPVWVQTIAAGQRLGPQVQAVMANPALAVPGAASCAVVTQGGRVLYDDGGSRPVAPASNMKILTAVAALDKLGPAFRFTTSVEADHAPSGGVLTGNLYLVGGGDPLLRTPNYVATLNPPEPLYTSLVQLAAQVKAAGISRITGSVVGDEARYDGQRAVPGWKPAYVAEGDVGPLSALDVDDGFLAALQAVPPPAPPPGRPPPAPVPAPTSPPVTAAQGFTDLLKAEGVQVTGPATAGTTPPGAVGVTSIRSAPLAQVLEAILTVSDDTGSELVTKELGRDFSGAGTTAAGTAVIRADLAADGFDVSQLVNLDGSGLDRSDRVSCALMVSVLQHEGVSSAVWQGLPVAAQTGTLAHRMEGTLAAGRVRAKTGTLDDVSALSGFVMPAPTTTGALAQPLVFAQIMNGVPLATGVAIGNQMAETLARYPSPPAAALVVPRPVGSTW